MVQTKELKTAVRLSGPENYQVWKFQIGIILKSMMSGDLLHTIKPVDEEKQNEWNHVENVAQCTIVTTVNKNILTLSFACEIAKKILEELEALHIFGQKFYAATYDNDKNICTHF